MIEVRVKHVKKELDREKRVVNKTEVLETTKLLQNVVEKISSSVINISTFQNILGEEKKQALNNSMASIIIAKMARIHVDYSIV